MVLSLPLLANSSWLSQQQPRRGEVVGVKPTSSLAQLSGPKHKTQEPAQDNMHKGNQVNTFKATRAVSWSSKVIDIYFEENIKHGIGVGVFFASHY